MSEATLTLSLVRNLENGGLKKIVRLQNKNFSLHREVGKDGYIADIFISLHDPAQSKKDQFSKFIAIEVKVKDWSSGFYQAWRYRNFAERSYLAIYKPYLKNVDTEPFETHGIGLIAFDEKEFEIITQPKERKFRKETYEYSIRQKIWENLVNRKELLPAC